MKLYLVIIILLIHEALTAQLAPRTISDAIHFLCTIEHYEDAYELYRARYGREVDVNYLDRRMCMKLFSAAGDSGMYFSALRDYADMGGSAKYIQRLTDGAFYLAHSDEIARILRDTATSIVHSEEAYRVIETFKERDQELRRMWGMRQLAQDEFRWKDSVNQVDIKELLASRELYDHKVGKAIFLLLRHASEEYLKLYRETGHLEHYAQKGLISYEDYYNAVGYITGTYYFTDPMVDGQDPETIEKRRAEVGLLPLSYSPLKSNLRNLSRDLPERTAEEKRTLATGLLKYVDEKR